MNFRNVLLVAALALLGYFGWEKFFKEPPPVPVPSARLAPEGVLIVVKRFSAPVPDGVHGFPVGKEVRLVKEDGDFFVVTDGIAQGRAPKNHFTNNLDEAEKLTGADRTKREAYEAKKRAVADQERVASEEIRKRQTLLEITRLEQQREQLGIKLEELEFEDEKIRAKIESQGRYNGIIDLWEISEKNKRAISQNQEASQKLDLKIKRLKSEIAGREAEMRVIAD